MTAENTNTTSRNVSELTAQKFDLVVIGAGVFGACAAWDAVLRGLSVVLIEKSDFGAGASANSYKVAHGGIRYLQHLDIARVRQSSHEKSALIRIAPHLVQPLPIVIPTYGYGRSGKWFLRAGTIVYDLLTMDRNRDISDPDRKTPYCRSMSRAEVLREFPDLPQDGLTGAVVMYDGQFTNPPRLVFAFVASAVARGAVAANYVEATSVVGRGHQDLIVSARDNLSGETFEINSRSVLNCAGPWAESLLNHPESDGKVEAGVFSRDLCFAIPRRLHDRFGLAVQAATSDPDAVLSRENRHLFMVPWREFTLVGVWHRVFTNGPDRITVEGLEKGAFIDEINVAYPNLNLRLSDVRIWNAGLVPFGEEQSSENDLRFGKRSRFIDHSTNGGPEGLFTLIGVRFTMGRGDSALAMRVISKYLSDDSRAPKTDHISLLGGDFDQFSTLCEDIRRKLSTEIDDATVHAIARNHGTNYVRLLELGEENPTLLEQLPQSTVLRAEIVAAARYEMCSKLSDIVLRRTDLASAGDPGDDALSMAADLAASELGWTVQKRDKELAGIRHQLPYGFEITDSGSDVVPR